TARCVGDTRHIKRPTDFKLAQVRVLDSFSIITNLRVGQRVVDRCDVVVNKLRVLLEKCSRYAVRTGFHGELSRGQVQAYRRGLRHAWINVQQRDTLSVDGNFELLVGHPSKKLARRSAMQQRSEDIVPIRWKVIHDGNPAARPERCSIDVPQ